MASSVQDSREGKRASKPFQGKRKIILIFRLFVPLLASERQNVIEGLINRSTGAPLASLLSTLGAMMLQTEMFLKIFLFLSIPFCCVFRMQFYCLTKSMSRGRSWEPKTSRKISVSFNVFSFYDSLMRLSGTSITLK